MTSTSTVTRTFQVRPIPPEVTDTLRVRDDAGNPPRVVVDRDGGSPLRCCLRASQPGERILLVSYAPLRRWSAATGAEPGPYDEVGPVFIHERSCEYDGAGEFPADFRGAPRMFRAYAAGGHILRGVLVEPDGDFEHALDELMADPEVAVVHARALEFGCFTFEVVRTV